MKNRCENTIFQPFDHLQGYETTNIYVENNFKWPHLEIKRQRQYDEQILTDLKFLNVFLEYFCQG